MSKMYARILSSLCLIVLSNYTVADDQVTLQLKGDANTQPQWEGYGISVTWYPDNAPEGTTLQELLDQNARYISVRIEDESNLTSEGQWLSLEKQLNLRKRVKAATKYFPPRIPDRSSRKMEGTFKANNYLRDGNPIPIYVYSFRESTQELRGLTSKQRTISREYEEYLHKTVFVSIPYSGAVKDHYESGQKRVYNEYTEAVAARTNQQFVLGLLGFISLLILWMLRTQLGVFLSWLGTPLHNLRNHRRAKNEHKQLLRTKELFDAQLLSQEEYDSRIAKIKSP
jgi:hypothetical protein